MQTRQQENPRQPKGRIGKGVTALIVAGVGVYFLRLWLAANKAAVSDQAIVYLTFALTLVSYLQWDTMAAQNAIIEKELDQIALQQRAWLAVRAAQISGLSIPEDQYALALNERGFGIVVRNSGTTPAVLTACRVTAEIRTLHTEVPTASNHRYWMALAGGGTKGVVIPPQSEVFFSTEHPRLLLCEDARAIGESATKELYLLGGVYYDDVFGESHRTVCVFRYDPQTGQFDNSRVDNEMT